MGTPAGPRLNNPASPEKYFKISVPAYISRCNCRSCFCFSICHPWRSRGSAFAFAFVFALVSASAFASAFALAFLSVILGAAEDLLLLLPAPEP
jgi:hypothetical protein